MNLAHLRYAVEVERCGSISKAAENLYMGQPNLSRAIKELEEDLGIEVFSRNSKGAIPTLQGEEFLSYAKSILAQVDEMESLCRRYSEDRIVFSISTPRVSSITHAFTRLVKSLDLSKKVEINYKETNSLKAIRNVNDGVSNLGIIRFQAAFESGFNMLLAEKGMVSELLWDFHYRVIMSKRHPLAAKEDLAYTDLAHYVEVAHGDPYVPFMPMSEIKKAEFPDFVDKRVFVYERGSQFDILSDVDFSYMWVSPIPQVILDRYGLVQKSCADMDRTYRDVLIRKKNYCLSSIDRLFMREIRAVQSELEEEIAE